MRSAFRWLIFSVIFVLALAYARFKYPSSNLARVTVINQSGERIASGTLELCGERTALDGMANGDSKRFTLPVNGDCHYEVEVKLLSGRTVAGGVGYVTHGMSFDDAVIIQPEKIALGRQPGP
ncbi:MAG TPA: hypothetical protein VFV50_16600 [Bdellovibrionales bacterium]|nr:hypothetical protein [Bdellovibrionales bacterium]